jgi:hypothetical protein
VTSCPANLWVEPRPPQVTGGAEEESGWRRHGWRAPRSRQMPGWGRPPSPRWLR